MLSDYIPENVIPSVKCFYIGKLVLGSVDIVVCTDTGYVVEFSNYKIKKKCSFSCCDAESIVPFSSYDPNHNFYIIKAKNVLVVVIRGEKLKLLESYTSVQKFAIRDFSGKGFPMVGIWIKTSKTPDIITNFADKTEVPGKEKANLLSGFLVDKLQEIRKITCESQLKLAEKQELRLKCTNNLEETLTKKFQPEMQEGSTADERFSEVHIANHWHRLHNGKWVLGATIRNRSNRGREALSSTTAIKKTQ